MTFNYLNILFTNGKAQLVVAVCLFSVSLNPAYAQTTESYNGIYLTEADFANGVISQFVKTDDQNYLDLMFDNLFVVRVGGTRKYKFGTIYGFVINGTKYRGHGIKSKLFGSYGYYKVIDDCGLIIYSQRSMGPRSNGNLHYYYSDTPTSLIKLISKRNLRKDFMDKPKFVELITKLKEEDFVREVNGRLLINDLYLAHLNGN